LFRLLSTRCGWIVTIAALIALPIDWYFTAYPRGMAMAYIDHACGHYEDKRYGLPLFFDGDDVDQLRENYGVTVQYAGCGVDPELEWYTAGYNPVSHRLLNEKFGKDIIAECGSNWGKRSR